LDGTAFQIQQMMDGAWRIRDRGKVQKWSVIVPTEALGWLCSTQFTRMGMALGRFALRWWNNSGRVYTEE
jgi:hypothetical protein